MRIAVCHNQPTGGARRALHGFCSRLMAHHRIDVFTLDRSDDDWLHDVDIAHSVQRGSLKRRRPVRFGWYANDAIAWLDQRDLDRAYRAMACIVDAGAYDVALVDVCRYSLVPSVLDDLETPSVFYAHNGPSWMEDGEWDPPLAGLARARRISHLPAVKLRATALRERQRSSVRAASVVATNSLHTAARLRAAYGIEPVVCPPGVAIPPSEGTGGSAFVLSVGEVEPRKGFAFLIEALACLGDSVRPPLRILANSANTTELARLQDRAERCGVALKVVLGPDSTVLAEHYASARVFVYGSHNEPLGLAPLEAMAHGTPVVAVSEGGVKETVVSGVTGYLTERDPEQFAECLQVLLENESLRTSMRGAARQHIRDRWSLETRAAALERLLVMAASTHGAATT